MEQDKFKKAYSYAASNPNSEFAIEFKKRTKQGEFNSALKSLGVDTSEYKKAEPKDNSFTGKLKRFGSSLIKSEKGFGESLAGAVQTQAGKPVFGSQGINPLSALANVTGTTKVQNQLNQAQQTKQDLIGQLTTRIQEKRTSGEDTTRLMKVLQDLSGTENIDETTFNLLKDKTAKQVIGEGVGVAADVIGAGTLATKVPGIVTKPTSLISGAVQGAKTGAVTGGSFGAVSGGARAAQDGESVTGGAVSGGIGGALLGGALGGVVGGVSGGVRGRQTPTDKALNNITPDTAQLSAKQYKEALEQGLITPRTATQPAQVNLSEFDKLTANKYSNLIKKDPVNTTTNIFDEIGKIDTDVGQFLKNNNGIFNNGELKNTLTGSIDDITDVMANPDSLSKAKTTLVDNFMKSLKKNDMVSLWQARKAFDKEIEKAFSGSPTIRKQIQREFRNSIQDFISQRTKSSIYTGFMQDMSGLFKLADLSSLKASKTKNYSAIGQYLKDNPVIKQILGYGAAGFIGKELLLD